MPIAYGLQRAILAGAVALAGATAFVAHSAAQDEPFFKGKAISIVVGSSAGGGHDTYARLSMQLTAEGA